MRKWNKLLALLLAMVMALSLAVTGFAADADDAEGGEEPSKQTGDIVILHTNDVHGKYAGDIGYAGLAAYKAEMAETNYVTLVDAGDFSQGEAIAILSKGGYLIDIMNKVGYDVVVPGNHEFDYGMEKALENLNAVDATVVSCNFVDLKENKPVFEAYTVKEYGDKKVAYVGMSTPETYTKSTPTYFQDENGEYIYSFCENELYETVQTAVDAALAEGVDYVVAIGHMGIDEQSSPWTSREVIAHTNGIDVFIDGHSHSKVENETVANKDGEDVVLAQTGDKLGTIGKVTIAADGTISAELVKEYEAKDEDVTAFIGEIEASFAEITAEVVAQSDVDLITKNEDGSWAVRSGETNMGDLIADAYRTVMDADIGIMNGGGIRANIAAGEVTMADILAVMTFGNMATVVEATGQQILDCLEMGASAYPGASGGFTHVSGMTYTINASIPSNVVKDDKGNFSSVDGEYRVTDVMVGDEPLDVEKTYTVACHSYWLTNYGDGMTMFAGAKIVDEKHEMYVDNVMLSMYIRENLEGKIGEQYAKSQGRITIIDPVAYTDVPDGEWYIEAVNYVTENNLMDGMTEDTFAPDEATTRAVLAEALYRMAGSPEVTGENPFEDVEADASYVNAVIWAKEAGVIGGVNEDGTLFEPEAAVYRRDIATMLARFIKAEVSGDEIDLSMFGDADSIDDWAKAPISWAVANGILGGNGEGNMAPKDTAKRSEIAIILQRFAPLYEAAQAPAEDDDSKGENESAEDTEAVEAATWGSALEMILLYAGNEAGEDGWAAVALKEGYIDAEVDGDAVITRAEACELLAKVMGLEPSKEESSFSDTDNAYVQALVENEIIAVSEEGTFGPEDPMTKDQLFAAVAKAKDAATWNVALEIILGRIGGYEAGEDGWTAVALEEGFIDSEVDGDAYITRLDTCELLAKVMKLEPSEAESVLPDTDSAYVQALVDADIIHGFPDGNFYPDYPMIANNLLQILVKIATANTAA